MSYIKDAAIEALNDLHQTIPYRDYCTIMDGLQEIETLDDRDDELDELWRQFGDVPMNLYTERIESPFLEWKAGTAREEIWRWFDQRYSKGVAYLMYGEAEDFVAESKQLYRLKKMCDECESNTCQFNHDGECRFALVHERKPDIVPDDGCRDYQFREV